VAGVWAAPARGLKCILGGKEEKAARKPAAEIKKNSRLGKIWEETDNPREQGKSPWKADERENHPTGAPLGERTKIQTEFRTQGPSPTPPQNNGEKGRSVKRGKKRKQKHKGQNGPRRLQTTGQLCFSVLGKGHKNNNWRGGRKRREALAQLLETNPE